MPVVSSPPIDHFIHAGFWRRFAAFLIDGFAVAVLNVPFLLFPGAQWITGIVVWWLYYPFFNSSALQGTPGKVYLGLAVTDEGGRRIGFRTAAIRELAEILSALMLGLGYFFNVFTDRRQALHDLIAGTLVLRRPVPESIDLWGAWKSEFQRVLRLSSPAAFPPSSTPVASSSVTSATSASPLADLEALHRLRAIGALTEEEYQRKKSELLARI